MKKPAKKAAVDPFDMTDEETARFRQFSHERASIEEALAMLTRQLSALRSAAGPVWDDVLKRLPASALGYSANWLTRRYTANKAAEEGGSNERR